LLRVFHLVQHLIDMSFSPIARRLLMARNDARMGGKNPVRARISPNDMQELKVWVRQQNKPITSGLPPQNYSEKNLWGMDIVEDAKVHEIIHLEFEKKK
jgi:hypothetical protein